LKRAKLQTRLLVDWSDVVEIAYLKQLIRDFVCVRRAAGEDEAKGFKPLMDALVIRRMGASIW